MGAVTENRQETAFADTAESKRQISDIFCYMLLIFFTGCFVGWLYEEVFYWATEGALRNRGVLYGPWLPIYGIGALCIYAMKPIKKYPAVLFLLCAGITGVVEYIIGWVGINRFGMRLWDYRGLFLNINGIICFRSVISFAVLGLIFQYLIEPNTEKAVKRVNEGTVKKVCLVLILLFIIDCIISAFCRTPITYV